MNSPTSRRVFVRACVGLACAAPAFVLSRKAAAAIPDGERLRFVHTHTGEALAVTYRVAGRYVPEALARVERFLRDFRSGEVHAIDPALLDQLQRVATLTGTREAFQVISGYRSPQTNEMLRRHSGGVAQASLHLQGRAVDVRLADVQLADLRDAARSLKAGGVGFYPASQFVHLDTGRARAW